MSHGGGGGQKSAKKVSRIIWMAPNVWWASFGVALIKELI